MGYLRDHMIEEMKLRGYSNTTINMYTKYVHKLAYYYKKTPLQISQSNIRDFFVDLYEKQTNSTTLHNYYCAIKCFYKIHGQPHYIDFIPHPKINYVIPDILDESEIETIFSLCRTLRYKLLFIIIYSAGLRISEAINLKISDIDFLRKTIHVRSSKNNKDRYTVLSEKAIYLLNHYINRYKPEIYLFSSIKDKSIKMSKRHCQEVFHRIVIEANIQKKAHIHTLRHSFATHLLENNTNLFYIMKLLGHSSIRTTLLYLHMQRLDKLNISSPLDTSNIDINKYSEVQFQRTLCIA
jgi:integrase/recombinase XerD